MQRTLRVILLLILVSAGVKYAVAMPEQYTATKVVNWQLCVDWDGVTEPIMGYTGFLVHDAAGNQMGQRRSESARPRLLPASQTCLTTITEELWKLDHSDSEFPTPTPVSTPTPTPTP